MTGPVHRFNLTAIEQTALNDSTVVTLYQRVMSGGDDNDARGSSSTLSGSASQRRPIVSGLQSLSAGASTRWARSGVFGFEAHPTPLKRPPPSPLARLRARPAPLHTTPAVRVAAVLSFLYGVAAAALGVWLTVAFAAGRGPGADTYEYFVFRGVTTTIVFSLIAGAVFVTEAFLVVRGARGIGVVVAGIVALGGLIGEAIKAVAGGDAASLRIDAGIIVAPALPAALLLLPRSPELPRVD